MEADHAIQRRDKNCAPRSRQRALPRFTRGRAARQNSTTATRRTGIEERSRDRRSWRRCDRAHRTHQRRAFRGRFARRPLSDPALRPEWQKRNSYSDSTNLGCAGDARVGGRLTSFPRHQLHRAGGMVQLSEPKDRAREDGAAQHVPSLLRGHRSSPRVRHLKRRHKNSPQHPFPKRYQAQRAKPDTAVRLRRLRNQYVA